MKFHLIFVVELLESATIGLKGGEAGLPQSTTAKSIYVLNMPKCEIKTETRIKVYNASI